MQKKYELTLIEDEPMFGAGDDCVGFIITSDALEAPYYAGVSQHWELQGEYYRRKLTEWMMAFFANELEQCAEPREA